MSKLQQYLEMVKKTPPSAHVPQEAIDKIKAAKTTDDAVNIALEYFKDPDDAEAFVMHARG
jgi:hypothetical protein